MDFFVDLKKNVLDAADKTKKKTSELTAIAKLSVSIKNEEAKLSDCYKSIGRLFYTAERDNMDNTEEIATYIMQADKIKANIEGYQKQLAILRKVVICEGCNSEVSNEAFFCPICGMKLPKQAEPVEEKEVCDCAEGECCCAEQEEETPCTCECECVENEEEKADETIACCCEDEEEPKAE